MHRLLHLIAVEMCAVNRGSCVCGSSPLSDDPLQLIGSSERAPLERLSAGRTVEQAWAALLLHRRTTAHMLEEYLLKVL